MIVHLMPLEKFIPPFIDFVNNNFDKSKHIFLIFGDIDKNNKYSLKIDASNVIFIHKNIKSLIVFEYYIYSSEKIIVHSLFSKYLIGLFYLQPWLLKKIYWVMWGGDFYFPKKQSWMKKKVIKRMGHFITYVKGDYTLAQKWYGANGKYHECFMYPSNLYKEYAIKQKEHSTINIQVGNSADPTNNHLEVFDKLAKYKDENINIYVPLSYGEKEYANDIILKGKEIFGDKFKPMTEFMPFDKYLEFLGEIDIAIFAHKRQQAMGNTITLLGLGKKVYMRSDITPWELFKDIKVKVFDVETIDLELFSKAEKQSNQKKIKEYFSEENYIKQLKQLFEVN